MRQTFTLWAAAGLLALLSAGAQAQEGFPLSADLDTSHRVAYRNGAPLGAGSRPQDWKRTEKGRYVYSPEKPKVGFKDSLDGAFDMSDWLITKKGFLPFPVLITEPALGGFGLGVAPVFIQPVAPTVLNGKVYPNMPNVTAGFAAYTLNDTWMVGAGRMGSIPKWKMHYKLGGAYADVNMNFYHHFELLGDQKFEFNIRSVPVYGYLGKILPNPRFEIGIDYLYMYSKLKLANGGDLPAFVTDKEVKSHVSNLGLQASYDSRDNTFTPDKGIKTYLHGRWSNPVIGSDYRYGNLEGAFYWFLQYGDKRPFVTGIRVDVQQVFGTAPFYLKPFVDMRGVPANRYQGNSTALIEVEQRWDLYKRWSLLLFGGTGKGFDSYSQFGKADWAYGYGAGFRYLIARKLKLRMGADFAMGNEGFAYYLVFGSTWMRQ